MNQHRNLTPSEINTLESRGCSSENWNTIFVHPDFNPLFCKNVEFSGRVTIGILGEQTYSISGMTKRSAIIDATIHNSTIGNHCYIRNVTSGIANYQIGDSVFVENVRLIAIESETTFGNGTLIPIMNEQGGRKIPMFTGLSAQIAYLLAFYRHRPRLILSLTASISAYVDSVRSSTGTIGEHTKIINCDSITNSAIGSYASLKGVKRLNNSTVNSCNNGAVELGVGVIADSIIINGNSRIVDGAIVDTCFIGEGCELAKHFSAEKSLFFSNFIGHHGEAFGIFAGPHTATHHKSTLLISGYMSFLNAGSGSNQSNHMYKLGPLHQGVIERGSKTSSDSYVLWPAHIGAFTLIMGRHMNHPDIADLPYSYLIESNGESLLVPGVNFKSVGTIRDADKWPTRDKRVTNSDLITYDLLTPYTVGKIIEGYDCLDAIIESAHHNERQIRYNGTIIPISAAEKGKEYYQLGCIKYIGNVLVNKLLESNFSSLNELKDALSVRSNEGTSRWIDLAGMTIPEESVTALIAEIESGKIRSVEQIHSFLSAPFQQYAELSWNWCRVQLEKRCGLAMETATVQQIVAFLQKWIDATQKLDVYFLEDAEKEFSQRTKISFGINGDSDVRDHDFAAVRGSIEENDFILKIHAHKRAKTALFETVCAKLQKGCS